LILQALSVTSGVAGFFAPSTGAVGGTAAAPNTTVVDTTIDDVIDKANMVRQVV
jgi:hypothetical protein